MHSDFIIFKFHINKFYCNERGIMCQKEGKCTAFLKKTYTEKIQ